jgi:hypothetical protein
VDDDNVVSEMDDERRQAILAEAHATLERVADVVVVEPDYLAIAMARKVEHPIDRDRRKLAKLHRRCAQEREDAAATSHAGWEAWLRDRLDAERAFVLECVGTALGEALRKERAVAKCELTSEVRSLRIELTEANEVIGELRKAIAAGKRSGEIIDLQPVARRN